ncbi:hypothetical protein ACUXV3_03780 [Roseobacteraceae bacterium NS-SX3]
MKLVTSVAAATLTLFTGAAAAGNADVSTNTGAAAELGVSAETGAEVSGSVSAQASGKGGMDGNYGQLISSLQNGKADVASWTSEISALSDDPEINIVTLDDISEATTPALDKALEDHRTDLRSARSAIGGNEDLAAALEAESFTADDVIAVEVEGENAVTLIVDSRA